MTRKTRHRLALERLRRERASDLTFTGTYVPGEVDPMEIDTATLTIRFPDGTSESYPSREIRREDWQTVRMSLPREALDMLGLSAVEPPDETCYWTEPN